LKRHHGSPRTPVCGRFAILGGGNFADECFGIGDFFYGPIISESQL
jgi:hypothetical protein